MFPKIWTEKDYQDYLSYLETLRDEKNKIFFSKTCSTKYEILGIKVPLLRKIAKEISKTDISTFLSLTKYKYYEEVLIKGFIIANIKEEKLFSSTFTEYIKHIDCWGICDSFCNSLILPKLNPPKYFKLAKKLSLNKKEFTSRVGLCIILFHYVKEPYLEEIYRLIDEITSDKYYVNMACAWLLCELYIKDKDRALSYLKNNHLNSFTQNKAISKIRDSYRVTKEEKDYLNTLKK